MDPKQLDQAIQGTLIMMGFPYDENKKGSAAIQLLELTADYTESSHLNLNQYRSKSIELNSQGTKTGPLRPLDVPVSTQTQAYA